MYVSYGALEFSCKKAILFYFSSKSKLECGRQSSSLLTGHFIKILFKEPAYICALWCPEIFFEIKARICCGFLVQIWVSLYSNDPFLVCNVAGAHISEYTASGWLASMKNHQKIAFSDSRLPRKKKKWGEHEPSFSTCHIIISPIQAGAWHLN